MQQVAPIIRRYAAEAEQQRRLSRPVVDAMIEAGFYRMARPRAFGGLELDPITIFAGSRRSQASTVPPPGTCRFQLAPLLLRVDGCRTRARPRF